MEPGLVCKFNSNSGLDVFRGLIAEGGATPDSNIVFTDYRDDFYGGDMNSDSTASSPTSNKWDGIYFDNQSLDALCRLDYCIIRFAGSSSNEAAITTDAASPTITNSVISDSRNGVRATGASNPLINYCDLYNFDDYGINNVNQSFNIDARYCWWGDFSGPTHATNPGGTGALISNMVNYADFVTVSQNPVMGDVSLNGSVQAYDASLVLQHVAASITLSADQLAVADVSDESGVTAYDASLILQYVSGSIDVFPAELKSAKFNNKISTQLSTSIYQTMNPEQYEILISSDALSRASALELSIRFDSDKLSITGVEKTDLTTDMMIQYAVHSEAGKLMIAMADVNNLVNNGAFIKVIVEAENINDIEMILDQMLINESEVIGLPFTINAFEPTGIAPVTADQNTFMITPNPVTDWFEISFVVREDNQKILLEIYDITGRKVADLLNGNLPSGPYAQTFEKGSLQGSNLSQGQYYVRFTSKYGSVIKPLLIQ